MSEASSSSALDGWIADWLAHQRALGRAYDSEEWVLAHLQRSLASAGLSDLDQAGFDRWCNSFAHRAATTRRSRQLTVRKFCLYRRRTEPDCYVPDPLYFVRQSPHKGPVIIDPEQVARMLVAADGLTPAVTSPMLPAIARIAVIMLYTCGLRRGELARLTLDDIEPKSGLLRIRASKFHKSRLVPLSSDAAEALRDYLRQRLAAPFSGNPSDPLLCCGIHGHHGYSGGGLSDMIRRLFAVANVHDAEGHVPRVHDMRHSFAVEALLRWYREGADVQSNLPRLAMYMGHVSIVSTAHYLHFVPATREVASQRFEAAFGGLIEEVSA
ncbi:MAG: tyrosine-type recombinase/integrase [Burkholderiales bacterium]|nr:tyrosine-type recombinase/integrase [Burkholderiales bacterium]